MTTCEGGSTDCNFTCPKGGSWFVCTSEPYFVGCCASDPCTNTNTTTTACPNLHPASFNSSIYGKILPNNCINNPSTDWYTCNSTTPSFLGCCKSNACRDGCPSDDLLPAAWSSAAVGQLQLFLDGKSPPTATSSTSTSTSTSSTTGASRSGLSSGAIAGIAIGAAAVLAIIFAVLFLRRRRRHREASTAQEGQRMFTGEYRAYHSPSFSYQDSHMGSPDQTVKHASGSSAGFTSESCRPISEVYSQSVDQFRPNHGLQISGMPTGPQVIPELDSDQAPRRSEIHELDGLRR